MQNQKAVNQYEKARVLHQKGKLSDAERFYKKAIKNNKNFVEAYNNLGNVLVDCGRLKEAADSYRKALKLLPDHPMLLNNLGNALQLRGKNEQALTWFEQAITQDPNYADAHANRGNALRGLGMPEQAIDSWLGAVKLDSALVEVYNNLGSLSLELARLDDAELYFTRAIQVDSSWPDPYIGLGNTLSDQGKAKEAITMYQKALAINPNIVEAYNSLGNVLSDQGEVNEAIAAYQKVIRLDPGYVEVYRSLSRVKHFRERDEDLQSMEKLFQSARITESQKSSLGFGIGKAYEDLEFYEKSMEFVIEASRLKRKSIEYIESETRNSFNDIKKLFSQNFFSLRKDVGYPDQSPLFIVGMPRSGTSLVEQVLASHPAVFGAGELNDLLELTTQVNDATSATVYPAGLKNIETTDLFKLGKEYVARLRRHSSEARLITDKMPHNFMRIGFIKLILPKAKIIHMTRDPMDNCLSIFKNDFYSGHGYAYDMTELGHYYTLYAELMEHWDRVLPGYIYHLSYETLVADQENQIRKLIEFCNLPWDDACLDFHKNRRVVKTTSNIQVRQPIYRDSVKLWKRYEKQLQPLHDAIYS